LLRGRISPRKEVAAKGKRRKPQGGQGQRPYRHRPVW
jgi:hypothetical protein